MHRIPVPCRATAAAQLFRLLGQAPRPPGPRQRERAAMSTPEQFQARPPVIRSTPGQANVRESWRRLVPAWVISAAAHAILLGLFVASGLLTVSRAQTAT